MGKLSTHVLDTYHGRPAEGVSYRLYQINALGERTLRVAGCTNRDGRSPQPLLEGEAVTRGAWSLQFDVATYFRDQGLSLPEHPFVGTVTIDFGIDQDGGSYHVPLVCTPWSWSTYRGS